MTFSLDLMGYIIADYGLDLNVLKSSLGSQENGCPRRMKHSKCFSSGHVALGGEDDGFQAVIRVLDLLLLDDAQEPGKNLRVGQLRVAEDGAPGLNGLWTRREESQALGQRTAGPCRSFSYGE